MILKKDEKGIIEIDLTGPDGNVFNLIGIAKQLAKLLNKRREAPYFDPEEIAADMMSSDYEHAVSVLEKHFGHIIVMYR